MSKAMWGGRFSKSTDEMINEFQASINFDKRMYHEDIAGSIAHATMLAKCGILTEEDRDKIVKGLEDIEQQIEDGKFDFSVDLEDIHMNIEKRLTEAIGEAGGMAPSMSMVSDLYPKERRSIAISLFMMGPHIGMILAMALGGWIAQQHGWRATFSTVISPPVYSISL